MVIFEIWGRFRTFYNATLMHFSMLPLRFYRFLHPPTRYLEAYVSILQFRPPLYEVGSVQTYEYFQWGSNFDMCWNVDPNSRANILKHRFFFCRWYSYNCKVVVCCCKSCVMLMRGLLKVVVEYLGKHFVFKLIHRFSMFNLDTDIKWEDFELWI